MSHSRKLTEKKAKISDSEDTMRERHHSQSHDEGPPSLFRRCKLVAFLLVIFLCVTSFVVIQHVNIRDAKIQTPYRYKSSSKSEFIHRGPKRKHPQSVPSEGSSKGQSAEPSNDVTTTQSNEADGGPLFHVEAVRKIRVLCIILTMEKDLKGKVAAVNTTWAARCDKHFYVLKTERRQPDILPTNASETRENIIVKIQTAFQTVYDYYRDDFDFILKTDDDTYIVMDNLKFLLSHYKSDEPGYIGFHFNKFITNGYMSGGAGYVISNRALRQLIERGFRAGACSIVHQNEDPENSEDLEIGRCLEKLGIPAFTSLDVEGRETFHAYTLERHLAGSLPGYLYNWARHKIKTGKACCSRYTISFHYVPPDAMYYMDFLLYEMSVFGHTSIPQQQVFKPGRE